MSSDTDLPNAVEVDVDLTEPPVPVCPDCSITQRNHLVRELVEAGPWGLFIVTNKFSEERKFTVL